MIEPRCQDVNRGAESNETIRAEFPSARYFQIHFEHMEGLLDETKRCLESLKRQLAEGQEVAKGTENAKEAYRVGARIKKTGPARTLTGDDRTEKPRARKRAPLSPTLGLVPDR